MAVTSIAIPNATRLTAAQVTAIIRGHQPTSIIRTQPDRTRLIRCRCGDWVVVRPSQVDEIRFAEHQGDQVASA